jgi:filamentous hemagglutinin family protein
MNWQRSMNRTFNYNFRQAAGMMLLVLAALDGRVELQANPTGGTVAAGKATFNTAGSQLTINQTSPNAYINWQSFNINPGETTTFVQPSSSSVAWNQINDANPSQILGNLNANGYVFLQNQNGFYVGGQASITAHGLIMTTAAIPAPDLSSGGAWSFNAPPPTAKIVNYGQIQTTGGGSAFLIASELENNGTISAPGGKIGLYAGEKVLVSMSPDGRGLSAEVTLPTGSVDNEGNLIANAGSIAAQAKFVNQGGLIQADSAQNVNGTIELVASDSLNLESSSVVSAQGGGTGTSAGGSVTLKSGNTFSDQAGSAINIAGGVQGGNGGQLEISAPQMSSIQSDINGSAAAGFAGGRFTLDPQNVWLAAGATDPSAPAGYTVVNVNSYSGLSQINILADNNITLNTLWTLTDPGVPAALTLSAGNNITINDTFGINAGNNWTVNLTAGTGFIPTAAQPNPASGNDGIYLMGGAYIVAQNGNVNLQATINLWAANEVQVGWMGAATGEINSGSGSISTTAGGSINVTTQYGDVNTGSDANGYLYTQPHGIHHTLVPPYYTVSSGLGGISTAAGGNVTIDAGNDVYSYNPSGPTDAGTGAFGSKPGNVNITAGDNIYGHYVLADGVGTISAGNTVGVSGGGNSFALSLVDGTWNVNAPNGNIYLQEVRNPNGVFNNTGNDASVAAHLFDYGADATVNLTAGIGVYLTGAGVPRLSADPVQIIYPPILDISAGSGGVNLQTALTLFPSVDQNLTITTTPGSGGSLVAPAEPGTTLELLMSDSSQTRWTSTATFSDTQLGAPGSIEPNDSKPVSLNISGNMENLTLITTKQTQISVGGNMTDCNFSGQNLRASDITSITVAGQIYNQSPYSFAYGINIPSLPASDLLPGMGSSWDDIFTLALNPSAIANLTVPSYITTSQLTDYIIETASLFQTHTLQNGLLLGNNPGFFYSPATGQLGFSGQMSSAAELALTQPLTVLHLVNGLPVINPATGRYETDTISWVAPSVIQTLYQASAGAPQPLDGQLGYRLGGPGQFDINAGSISLGNSYGILSCGVSDPQGGLDRYNNLASITPSGATVNIDVSGNLDMLTSTIAAIGGGDVNVTSTGGSMDLGSAELFNIPRQVGFGIFTSGDGNVNVTALGDINIDGSRIAAFDGGSVTVESQQGTVNVGSGATTPTGVWVSYVNSAGHASFYAEQVYGSGIDALTLINTSLIPGSPVAPGDITVTTPRGDIVATLGGILQEALNGNIAGGPTVTLTAGTLPTGKPGEPGYSPGYAGNIDLGQSGVIGGTVNLTANGNISGIVISRQNSSINAARNFTGILLSGGPTFVAAGGTVSGTIIGVGGASVSGSLVSASVLGQNVSVNGGAATSTLGSSANATSSSQSASQQANQTADQVASTDMGEGDNDKKKPVVEKTGRVTVLLSAATPGQ